MSIFDRLPRCALLLCVMGAVLPASVAQGQEAINTPAATQPGAGSFVNTYKLRFTSYKNTPDGSGGSANEV
ncbi:MAG: hypothetical protein ACNA8P_03100, partial [Phycisphaerales bacterium]